jgi:general secretion pathway protein E
MAPGGTRAAQELIRQRGLGLLGPDPATGGLRVSSGDPHAFEEADALSFALGVPVCLGAMPQDSARDLAAGPRPTTTMDPDGDGHWLHELIIDSIRAGSSDIHVERFGDELVVRRRTDGELLRIASIPAAVASAAFSWLKIRAGLDIAERRLPQDGLLSLECDGRSVDLRLSALPTVAGESLVMRVLDAGMAPLRLEQLGMDEACVAAIRAALLRPDGLLLVTGPTSSGKTTTLYAALGELNVARAKLLTVEDPVEYSVDGVVQVAINPAAGLTFPTALRAFLRHDPDVLMVGEIRDQETARIAVQAALTGHRVLATLHTTDAIGAIERLVDNGIERSLLASALVGVIAQRLVRRTCRQCSGSGCVSCDQSGHAGRAGIFEWLPASEGFRDRLLAGDSGEALRRWIRQSGVRSLRQEGMRLAAEGITTETEVLRCT